MNLEFLNDDSIFLKPIGWPKLKKKIDKLLGRIAKFIEKVECQKLRAAAKDQAEECHNKKGIRQMRKARLSTYAWTLLLCILER